jgi:hypothetical protein
MAAKKSVIVAPAKAVTGWADRVRQAAAKQVKSAEYLGGGSNWISFKGGLVTVNGATSPDGRFNCVILAMMQERAWYEGEFDASSPQTPDCYGYGDSEGREPVTPHEKTKAVQNKTCKGCPHDEWGSAQRGRGKACRQGVRLALVPATPDGVEGPVYFARVPPTSIKNVKGWLTALGDTPSFAVLTEIQVKPSAENMFDVLLTPKADIPAAFQGAILEKLDAAETELRQPYPELEERTAAKPQAKEKKRGKF